MTLLIPAQAAAQLFSLIVFGTMAVWYVVPWLRTRKRGDALVPLVWIHVFRYVALQTFSAQRDGLTISDGGVKDIVAGDVTGAVIAFAILVALRMRSRVAIPLTWLLIAETTIDTTINIRGGIRENRTGAAGGVTWLIIGLFVPLLIVSLVLIVWQLYTRRREPIDSFRHVG